MQFQNEQSRLVFDIACLDPRVKSVLWIGFCTESDPVLPEALADEGREVTFLEVYLPNVEHIRRLNIGPCIHRDVLLYADEPRDPHRENGLPSQWDLIVWQHGPQTVHEDELWPLLPKLELRTNVAVLLQMPMGSYNKTAPENPFDVHLSVLYPEQFITRGYEVMTHTCRHERSFTAVKYTHRGGKVV